MTTRGQQNRRDQETGVDLSTRLALRPKEAAAALGVCEKTLRALGSEIPCVRTGGVVLYPVKALEEWLSRRAASQGALVNDIVDDVVTNLTEKYE